MCVFNRMVQAHDKGSDNLLSCTMEWYCPTCDLAYELCNGVVLMSASWRFLCVRFVAFVVVFCYLVFKSKVLYEPDRSNVEVPDLVYVFLWLIRCSGIVPCLLRLLFL